MTTRSASGNFVSVCQTRAGFEPVTASRAIIMSASRLRPGKRMTADFIAKGPSSQLNLVILDHCVGDQLVAHRLDLGLGLGPVHLTQFDLEIFALAHMLDATETQM